MKNIHVLPTDKPSRIIKGQDNVFILLDTYAPNWFEINLKTTKQNIYITSDEEIKEGDWFICQNGFEKKCVGTTIINNEVYLLDYLENTDRLIWCKKIILTTDVDLIKDGVQVIDDEFLEWFVKNPSCEEVEVVKHISDMSIYVDDIEKCNDVNLVKYEIIILKEDWLLNNPQCKQIESCSKSLSKKCICPKEKPKQETTSEGFHRISKEFDYSEFDFVSFKIGAEWQQERMYSEEDIREAFIAGVDKESYNGANFDEWLEKIKNK